MNSPVPRILIVTTVPETLATILRDQPRFLARFFDVQLATSPRPEAGQVVAREGLPLYQVSMTRGIHPPRDFMSLWRMARLVGKLRPDIVHSYTPKAGLVAMLAALICRVPVRVHTFTGLIFPTQSGLKRKVLMWVDRLICNCATHVVPEGDGVKKDLVRFSITRKPLEKIGYGNIAGVDIAHYSRAASGVVDQGKDLRRRTGIGAGEFVFVFVGRLNRDKGVRELVRAFESLSEKAHLLLVGAIDRTAPIDAGTLAVLAENRRIHHLGFQTDIRPALACADVLVLPSYREGFPNSVLQAGAMELPVIATDVSGSNEVIEPGFNGWLVAPRNEGMLRDAMRAAMRTPRPQLAEMGKRARARIEERFERMDHWKRMIEFYTHCLASKHLPVPSANIRSI